MSSKNRSPRPPSFLSKLISWFRHENKQDSSSSSSSSSSTPSTNSPSPSPPSPSPPSSSISSRKASSFRLMRSFNTRYSKMDMKNRGGYGNDYDDDDDGDGKFITGCDDGASGPLGKEAIQLGGKPKRPRVRCLSMASIDWEARGSKVRDACEQVLKKGYPHLNDLFQGNPILNIHFPTASTNPHNHHHHSFISSRPSNGFLHER